MTEPQRDQVSEEVDRALDSLLAVGRMWASHGIRIGRSALETSARTLDLAASTLSDLAEKFEPDER